MNATTAHPFTLRLIELHLLLESKWVRVVGRVELANGEPHRIFGAFQNVTEKVAQRQAIEYAHERITNATESASISVWDWNPISNVLVRTPKLFTLFGLEFKGEEPTYELLASSLHPEDRVYAEKALNDAINCKEAKDLDSEFRVIWPYGSIHNIRATAQLTRNSER